MENKNLLLGLAFTGLMMTAGCTTADKTADKTADLNNN